MTNKFVKRIIGTLATVGMFLVVAAVPQSASAATATQKVSYYIGGDCNDYYDDYSEYVMLEEYSDWDCYITVKVKPVKPARTVKLQWWDDEEGVWVTEWTSKTNSKGVATLEFDPYCDDVDTGDSSYCDGTWDYRVSVPKSGTYKATNSITWTMSYYPYEY